MNLVEGKKRELLPQLKGLILKLTSLSADVAKLELSNNDDVSARVRRELLDFQNKDLKDFRDSITGIRSDIIRDKKRKRQRDEDKLK